MAIGDRVALSAHHHPGSDRVSERLYCKGVVLVEERGHSPPPPPIPSYCTGVIIVEERGHSLPPISLYSTGIVIVEERGHSPPPPPNPIFVGGPGIYHFSTLSVRGQLSRGIYHFSTFVGGGVFSAASISGGSWPNVCAIDAEPPFTERQC